MVLKLRDDYKAHAGRHYSLRALPRRPARQRHRAAVAASRHLMLGEHESAYASEYARMYAAIRMPLYEYQCEACGTAVREIQKFSDPPLDVCPNAAKARSGSCYRRRRSSSRASGCYITDYAKKSATDGQDRVSEQQRQSDSSNGASRSPPDRNPTTETSDVASRATSSSTPPAPKDQTPAAAEPAGSTPTFPDRALQVFAERLREIRPPQREIDDRLQESQLVAGVVADAVDLGSRRSAASSAAAAARWSAGSRRSDPSAVASSAGKMSGVRM